MSDPEILDPEPNAPPQGGIGPSGALVDLVGRAFPGAVVRTRGLTIEVEGAHDVLKVVQLPTLTLAVFRGMRIPVPNEPDAAHTLLKSLATGERVLVEERGAGALRRTHLVRTDDGRFAALEDTGVDREEVARGVMRVVSFADGVRDARPLERDFVVRASGGTFGRLKRKLMEKVLDKTIGAVVGAVQERAADLSAEAQGALRVDDGARTLPGKSER